MFRKSYGEVFEGDENWQELDTPEGDRYAWDDDSTYVKRPPYFEGMDAEPAEGFEPIEGARALALLGDSVTTDHISPAGRDQEGLARRRATCSSTASSSATSTPTARAAATTR